MAARCALLLAALGLASLLVPGQGQGAGAPVLLNGAGATFPAPLYKKWIDVYTKQNPGIVIDYRERRQRRGHQALPGAHRRFRCQRRGAHR